MENLIHHLKSTRVSSAVPETPASSCFFAFSKQFAQGELAEKFAQKAPAQIVTALNITKIAPALFFAIEKVAIALEKVLNAGVSLLAWAFDSLEVVPVVPFPKLEEKPVTPGPAEVIKVEKTDTPTPPKTGITEEPPVVQPKVDTPNEDEVTTQPPGVETPKEDVMEKPVDSPVEPIVPPPAASNAKRNLLIGAGLAVLIGGIVYAVSRIFIRDPRPLYPCHPNSGEICFPPKTDWIKSFDVKPTDVCHPDDATCELTAKDFATCSEDSTQTCWTSTQLLNGEIARMTMEERNQRDILLASYAHNSSAFEFGENDGVCWVEKRDSNHDFWCQYALCKDAPNGDDVLECTTEESWDFSNEDGSPYTVLKQKSDGDCVEVTCNERFACDSDPVCEE